MKNVLCAEKRVIFLMLQDFKMEILQLDCSQIAVESMLLQLDL